MAAGGSAGEILEIAASLDTAKAHVDVSTKYTIFGKPWSYIATDDAHSVREMQDITVAAARLDPTVQTAERGVTAPTSFKTDVDFLKRVLYSSNDAFLNYVLREIHVAILINPRVQGSCRLLFDESIDDPALIRLRANPRFMHDFAVIGTRDDKRWAILMFFCLLKSMQNLVTNSDAVEKFIRNMPDDARIEFRAAQPIAFAELLPQLRHIARQSIELLVRNEKMLAESIRIYELHAQRVGLFITALNMPPATTPATKRPSATTPEFPETWSEKLSLSLSLSLSLHLLTTYSCLPSPAMRT